MSESPKKFYLTTPIYYVNARPHIGHAYTTIVADVIGRRHRLLGNDTFFLTGTDEHGQKIERSATAAGIPPQQFADQVSASFRALWDRMGITYNDYIRTTDEKHKRGVQKLWKTLADRGAIYLSTYTGQYSVGEEMFVEGPPGTIGPDGKPTETVTEENYFFRLSDYQLRIINLIESGELSIQPEVRRNEVLSFLRGNVSEATKNARSAGNSPSAAENSLPAAENFPSAAENNAVAENDAVILSEAKNPRISPEAPQISTESELGAPFMAQSHRDMIGVAATEPLTIATSAAGTPYVPGALKDLSISRSSFKWGIPVPGEPQTAQDHVVYVWLDALTNYMTAIGYGSEDPADIAKFEKYWPADLHLVGKEIIRFHCVYWPAFLLAAGLPLPKAITAHGWLLFEDSKMSKSRGNIVRTETILEAFGTLKPKPVDLPGAVLSDEYWKHQQDLFASDVLRYFLLREIPFGQDGSFSFDALVQRYNSDLANGYGNLVSRTLKMVADFRDRSLPERSNPDSLVRLFERFLLPNEYSDYLIGSLLEKRDFSRYLEVTWGFIAAADNYISVNTPWKLAKNSDDESQHQLSDVLYAAAESIRIITALLYPILPYSTAQVWQQLGLGDIETAAAGGELKSLQWGGLKPGTKLGQLAPIFPRAPKELIEVMANMENPNIPHPDATVALPHITNNADASAHAKTEFRETPISSLSATPSLNTPAEHLHAISEHHTKPAPATHEPAQTAAHINIDDFAKIDLRVAKILVAERIPKADKLLRLEVDLGTEKRQILSGIAEWYTPEDLIGRRIVVIANLAPRKMRGLESHGMLLAASHGENGKPILATFADTDEIALGARLK